MIDTGIDNNAVKDKVQDKGTMNENLLASWKKVNEIAACLFMLIIFAIFPLIFHDYYFDILKVKYVFYYGTIILMAIVMFTIAIIFVCIDGRNYHWENIKSLKSKINIKVLRKSDWAMIAF